MAQKVLTDVGVIGVFVLSGSLLNEALDDSETGIDVDDGTDFLIGDVIKVDNEQMDVTNIVTNTLTVTRAVNSTSAATHDDDTEVEVRPFEKITVSTTAIGFTTARIPEHVVRASCCLEGADVRWRTGGAAPTASNGKIIYDDSEFVVKGVKDIGDILFIRAAGTDATLTVVFETEG